jgi:hypothetical protein
VLPYVTVVLQELSAFQQELVWCTAEMEEEGLLLDALAVTAQPLVIVANAISPEQCRAAGLQSSQMTVVCKRPPYQLQLRVQQVIVIVREHVDEAIELRLYIQCILGACVSGQIKDSLAQRLCIL